VTRVKIVENPGGETSYAASLTGTADHWGGSVNSRCPEKGVNEREVAEGEKRDEGADGQKKRDQRKKIGK